MSDNIVISTMGLTKFYGDILAVDHIDFEVKSGEIFGFLGPNGAGKTTTIRMLTGLSRPSAGGASILGFDINSRMAEAKRHIGVVPEISNLYDELSAMDNMLFMARLYGVSAPEKMKRSEELLRTFGLFERRNNLFRTFSRGMKRALTIAAALVHKPRVLFLDEPTVGLDVAAARSLRNMIANLRNEGATIFLTTHYLEETDLLCDRIAILVRGKVIAIDTPRRLKDAAGGESVIEISFDVEISDRLGKLSERLRNVRVAGVDEKTVRFYGGDPGNVYDAMFQFSRDNGIAVRSVKSITPTLEDAFMKITGLSPMVMAVEKGR